MIMPKSLKDGQWQKNEGTKPQRRPKAMAKYKEGRADIRGHENWTIQNTKLDSSVSQSQASTSTPGAHLANDLGLRRIKIQKVRIVISQIIIWRLTSRLGRRCLGHGDLR
jgi:hypothetical protein